MEFKNNEQKTIVQPWIIEEGKALSETNTSKGVALKLEEGKVCEVEVLTDKPFEKWVDPSDGKVKKIIPLIHNGIAKVFWLNVRNPLYSELITELGKGVTKFKILQTGNKDKTKYVLLK